MKNIARLISPFRGATALWLLGSALVHAAPSEGKLTFNRDIRPILSDKCFACHGTDAKHREAKLRLDLAEGAYRENEGIIPIKPGDLEKSDAWARIISDDKDEVMPPPKSHKLLSKEEKELIRRWIVQGASYEKHWAFEQPVKADNPPVKAAERVRNPIDAFLIARLEAEGLSPSQDADKPTLLRRATLAITGLPPTPREFDMFMADAATNAYENLIDRLLASPRFGEHMAHWWLDLARYGDTHGLHLDNERQMWLYRDWVIDAFNRNLSFDQFTIEQLAGDQLPNPTVEQKIATGFNRCNASSSEGGAIPEELRFRYSLDRMTTTVQTWLGLTAQCATCHDHKFDPITQKEVYQLYAFFNSAADPALDGNKLNVEPIVPKPTEEQQKQLASLAGRIAAAGTKASDILASLSYRDPVEAPEIATPRLIEEIWMEDGFPSGATPQVNAGTAPLTLAGGAETPAASGKLAIKRTAKGIGQDFFNGGGVSFRVPRDGIISVMARIDGARAVMLQFHVNDWEHRAVWGEQGVISYGTPGTPTHFLAGDLPAAGQWTALKVPAEKLGLKAGDKIDGYSFAQFDGTVYWDRLTMNGVDDPANDPARSLAAWLKSGEGRDTPGVPPNLNLLLKKSAGQRIPEDLSKLRDYFLQKVCVTTRGLFEPVEKEIAAIEKERADLESALPSTFVMGDTETPRDSFVMERGQYDKPGEKVQPGTPAILPELKAPNPRRLDLARWLVSGENPLTARVTVNRFWQQFFGQGLVKTSADFGSQGEAPSNPELLDWLAVNFRETGWDMKLLIKTMLTSSTWRQTSRVTPELLARDPENRLLARGPRVRMNAEAIRDEALFVSGLLVEKSGGRGVRTYQPPNIWEPVAYKNSTTHTYKQDTGDALYRRSIYTFLKRTAPAPFLANFDAPSREGFCTRRERSDTPLQALQLLNDVQFFEAARVFAQRLLAGAGTTAESKVTEGFKIVLGRLPEPRETERLLKLLNEFTARYQAEPDAAKAVIANGDSKAPASLDPAELAAWTQIGNLLLNLDENVAIN
ncbi:MAG: Planctomycete cytochrome [Chthoniobacteraceae bacterium]|nr:Planctomycete cytochrome [Chthoniobacteraceae bacterium]